MGNVLPFTARSNQKKTNQEIAKTMMFHDVLQEMHKETGIDWLKLCTGDPHEQIRYRTKLAGEIEKGMPSPPSK
ncbi:hypothetical protein [Brevibacillus sp. DP1.3A]|uniref:hypothetical protein n=1 Tax=Brevibacillus sp. DP1.3A TaxID=2738867 RepID=UPI00156A9F8E|nr:hypothetical protein [Brevibacillus sp. DP1.3A]UED78112.1 hypothetical protein HP399_030955 [Brevibacillus sp. DP1.3A]